MSRSEFFQQPPELGNQYAEDSVLRSYLKRWLPEDVRAAVEPDLNRFGQRVVGDIWQWARDAQANEPKLVPYDPWGKRIDHIEVSRGWQELERISAEEGLVASGYERQYGPWSRIYQFVKLYLFNPSSAVYTCPLAMADGAARLIELHGDAGLKRGAFRRLTTRDPQEFWTSGQWMTERTGGSDVGGTSTIAKRDGDHFRLYGTKWFTSATTSQMAMTLARIEDSSGKSVPGSRGLSAFYLETRNANGDLNEIVIHRLKDKLGTKALPTAELTMNGTPAQLIGQPEQGVRTIVDLVNVTRLYNSVCAVSLMRRGMALARDYASRRVVFGKPLAEQPLHLETLATLQVEFEAAFHLAFYAIGLMGRDECGKANADETAALRLLTPLCKLYTAKRCVAVTSEVLESFGGAGYVEDTGLPQLLRDGQVLSIWEGTTNVLSLDVLRAIQRDEALEPLLADMRRRLARVTLEDLAASAAKVSDALDQLGNWLPLALADGLDGVQAGARGFAMGLAGSCAAALMLEHAQWSAEHEQDQRAVFAANRFCAAHLITLLEADRMHREASRCLALEKSAALTETAKQPAGRT